MSVGFQSNTWKLSGVCKMDTYLKPLLSKTSGRDWSMFSRFTKQKSLSLLSTTQAITTRSINHLTRTSPSDLITESIIKLSDGSSFFLRKSTNPTTTTTSESDLPPLVHKPTGTQRIYLTQAEKVQMQSLRTSDAKKWSVFALSRKFNCTVDAVEAYSSLPFAAREEQKKEYDLKFDAMKWTEKLRIVNRIRRKAQW